MLGTKHGCEINHINKTQKNTTQPFFIITHFLDSNNPLTDAVKPSNQVVGIAKKKLKPQILPEWMMDF